MARIFLAWELGSNLGHLMSIWPVAAELCSRGHHVTMAVKDLARFAQIDNQLPITVVQSPLFFPPAHSIRESFGYCDILATGGYRSLSALSPLVFAWRQLFDLTQADVVVCQHAPTALLTARTCGLPAVVIGSGFMCPPAVTPLPGFSDLTAEQRERLIQSEKEILNICNGILEKYSAPRLENFADLFRDASTILCIYPELDHYGVREGVEYIGPLYADAVIKPVLFPAHFGKNILVYLNNFKYWKNMAEAFKKMNANILCAAVGLPEQEIHQARAPHITIKNGAIPLEPVYQQADLVICHGGPGVVGGALAAKKPVLILPTQKEQQIMANLVARQHYGSWLPFDADALRIQAAMATLLSDDFDRAAIRNYAARYAHANMNSRVNFIVEKILSRELT